ncbi:hypothetical protein Dsin_001118 [Dipteronia sinensis]|uniref:Uncharacterized protein n=1 Tax=Dipteronia sinensis TaxID=43782 RepID=A0AAE0EIP5_9ROSI|nr:hypothetical protein Dsin_001118 [Dipteronia sinensis]
MVGNICHCDMFAGPKMIEVLCLPYRVGFVGRVKFHFTWTWPWDLAAQPPALKADDITIICSDEKVLAEQT